MSSILFSNDAGYITREKIGKSECFVVYVHKGVAAYRQHTIGVTYPDAFAKAKSKLGA